MPFVFLPAQLRFSAALCSVSHVCDNRPQRCNGTLPRLTTTLSAPLVAIHPRAAQLKDGGHMFYDPDIRQQALWDIQKAMEDCPRIAAETMETCVSAFCFWCERRLTFVCLLVCAASP